MTFVVTRLCQDCKDLGCVKVCPMDCILEHRPPCGRSDLPNQVFIDPEDCIDCGLCTPECPWEAIFPDVDVPDAFKPDVALNAIVRERREEFVRPEPVESNLPDPAAVEANKQRWAVRATEGS